MDTLLDQYFLTFEGKLGVFTSGSILAEVGGCNIRRLATNKDVH